MPTAYDSPERKEIIRRMKKFVTGSDMADPKCAGCGRSFSDDEIIRKDFVYSVAKGYSVQYCHDCFRIFFRGGDLH